MWLSYTDSKLRFEAETVLSNGGIITAGRPPETIADRRKRESEATGSGQ